MRAKVYIKLIPILYLISSFFIILLAIFREYIILYTTNKSKIPSILDSTKLNPLGIYTLI